MSDGKVCMSNLDIWGQEALLDVKSDGVLVDPMTQMIMDGVDERLDTLSVGLREAVDGAVALGVTTAGAGALIGAHMLGNLVASHSLPGGPSARSLSVVEPVAVSNSLGNTVASPEILALAVDNPGMFDQFKGIQLFAVQDISGESLGYLPPINIAVARPYTLDRGAGLAA